MSEARLYDLGYRHYEGVRLGPSSAVTSLSRHTFGALVGLRRSLWAKVLTGVIVAIAYGPAVVFVGLAVFVPRQLTDLLLPGTAAYLGSIITAVYLFIATGVPQALCPDRRHGTLALYLASPLNRDTYLAAKAAAVAMFLSIVTVGPTLVLIVGLTILDAGPSGIGAVTRELGRAVASGLLLAAVLGSFAMAVSSLTDRRTAAGGAVILWLLTSRAIITGLLAGTLGLPDAITLLDVTGVALASVEHIYGASTTTDLPALAVLTAAVVWTLGAALFLRTRYQHLRVTR